MFRRIAGSLSKIFRSGSQEVIHGNPSVQIGNEIGGKSEQTLSSALKNEPRFVANRALREAMKELSGGTVKHAPPPSPKNIQDLLAKPVTSLTVEELEMLARAYYSGESEGTEQDITKAVELWAIATEKGSIESKFCLAQCLLDGQGIEANLSRGFQMMFELSEKNNYEYAHYTLGKLYESGKGTPKDYTKAVQAYKKAALGGIAPSLHNIANAYADGRGVEQNLQMARRYYEAAVEAEDPYAFFTLGQWYYHGKGGLAVDKSKAFELQLKAAERDHPLAMFNIGTAYLTSDGVKQDYERAQYWLWKAHNANVTYASLNLAKMYIDGVGVERDYEEAKSVLMKIIDKNPVAKELLAEIEVRQSADSSQSSEK